MVSWLSLPRSQPVLSYSWELVCNTAVLINGERIMQELGSFVKADGAHPSRVLAVSTRRVGCHSL
jgi:hypothetical protein